MYLRLYIKIATRTASDSKKPPTARPIANEGVDGGGDTAKVGESDVGADVVGESDVGTDVGAAVGSSVGAAVGRAELVVVYE